MLVCWLFSIYWYFHWVLFFALTVDNRQPSSFGAEPITMPQHRPKDDTWWWWWWRWWRRRRRLLWSYSWVCLRLGVLELDYVSVPMTSGVNCSITATLSCLGPRPQRRRPPVRRHRPHHRHLFLRRRPKCRSASGTTSPPSWTTPSLDRTGPRRHIPCRY